MKKIVLPQNKFPEFKAKLFRLGRPIGMLWQGHRLMTPEEDAYCLKVWRCYLGPNCLIKRNDRLRLEKIYAKVFPEGSDKLTNDNRGVSDDKQSE